MRPAFVGKTYRVAKDSDGFALAYCGRPLYIQVYACPSCHEELSESGRDRWNHCPFCGREIKWK